MPDQGALQDAYHYCDRIARRRARNFYPAFRFLPKSRRLALSAFYAFCSLSDDIADDLSGQIGAERKSRLADWRAALDHCFKGQADSALFLALQDAISRYQLPQNPFEDLLDGIEMDLEPRRFSTFAELEVYCRNVASSVGRVSVRIFGCYDSGADQYADALGIAFQLTNILRDVGEDLRRRRLYLPQEDLDAFSYREDDFNRKVYDDRFRSLMRFEYDRALSFFSRARPELAGAQARKLLPAEVMKSVYRRTLEELRRRDFRVFDGRISIPRWRMISGVTQTLLRHLV